jgi:hypothetical protein
MALQVHCSFETRKWHERWVLGTYAFGTATWRFYREQIDPTLTNGILDRPVNNAHRIQMRGNSMRKNRGKPNT